MNTKYKIIILLFIFFSFLHSKELVLKIAVAKDLTPYTFEIKKGEVEGLLIDYWKLWSKKTGIKVEFVASSWSETLASMKNKQIDIHSGLFKNKQREKYVNFLKRIYNVNSSLYINKINKDIINNLNDLKYKKVAVVESSFYDNYLKKNYPDIILIKYKLFDDLINALKNKEVDALLNESLVTWYYLIKNVKSSKIIRVENINLKNWFYAGIIKNNKKLEKLVLNGMEQISNDDILKLEETWIDNESFRNFKYAEAVDILNEEEKQYLKHNKNVRLSVLNSWPKFSFLNEKKELLGFHIDLIKQINDNLNTNIKIISYDNWKEAYKNSLLNKNESIAGLSWSKKRDNLFSYSPAYHYSKHYIVINKDNIKTKTFNDLENKVFVSQKNNISNDILEEKFIKPNIIHVNTINDMMKAIKNKDAEAVIISKIGDSLLKKYNLKVIDSIYTKYGNFAIGTSKNNKILSNIYKKGINSLSKEQLAFLNKKWFSKEKEESIFTKEELEYIKNAPKIKVGVLNWGEILFLNKKNEIDGLAGDILKKIEEISSLKFIAKEDTWPNLINKIKNNEIDIIPTIFYSKEREKFANYSQSYFKVKEFIYVNKNNKEIKSFFDLKNKKVAVIKEFKSIKFLKENVKNIKIVETNNLEKSIIKLINNEVDAIFETQVSINSKIKELFLPNLKAISQDIIKAQNVHIMSKKDDLLLASILQKSLYSIPNQDKNIIISKWLNKVEKEKELTVSFAKDKEPYVLNKKYLKGIEYDLVEHILKMSDINIKKEIYLNVTQNMNALSEYSDIDIAVNVIKKDNSFYYSNSFLRFEDILVSKRKDNYTINSRKDLEGKRISAYKGAYKYIDIISDNLNIKEYKEEKNHEKQVIDFFNNKSDVIILDKNIFTWYLKKLSNDSISKYKFHYIFPKNKPFTVAFRNENLRNVFNKNLKKIKDSGKFQEIVDEYLLHNIEKKIEVASFLSNLLSKYILEENIIEIENISNVFSSLAYINNIEVFDNNTNIYSSNNKMFKHYIKQDSYFNFANIPKKVGFVKVYFNNQILENVVKQNNLIPKLKEFTAFSSYLNIKDIYEKHSDIKNINLFTQKEMDFIKRHRTIKYSSLNWEPISITKDDTNEGIMHDYIKIIENKTGLTFQYEESKSWEEIINKFKDSKIDLFPNITNNSTNHKESLFSQEISHFHFAIVTREDGQFANDISDLRNKTLALPKGFPNYNFIKKNYPNINIIETKTMKEALTLVSKEKAYAFVAFTEVAIFNVKNYFPNLKISGITEDKFIHKFMIQKEYPELQSIINKVLSSISSKQKQEIRDKWIVNKIKTEVDYSLLYNLLAIFIFILLIILYFLKKLSLAKNRIEKINQKLEEEKIKFEILFNDTSDAVILVKDGKYIDANDSVIRLFKYKNKEHLINTKAGTISPQYQFDGELSTKKMKRLLTKALDEGSVRFEWQAKTLAQDIIWIEIVVTKIYHNNEEILHLLCRDINKKKILEKEIEKKTNQIKEQKNLFEALFNGTSDGLTLFEDGKIIDCNIALLEMFMIKDKNTLINSTPGSLSPKYQPNKVLSISMFEEKMQECLSNGISTYECLSAKTTKEEFWISTILINIKTNQKNLIYSIIRDISKSKYLEEEVRIRSKELESFNDELEDSNEELQTTIQNLERTHDKLLKAEKMASLGALVAGVAHEINTPVGIGLTGITHFEEITSEIVNKYKKDEISQEAFEEYLNTSKDLASLIHKNLKKAASLVSSFKQVAVDQTSEEQRIFNLKEYIYEILSSINSVTKKTNIKIDIICDDELKINSYPGAISQIITNLIMNSIIHGFNTNDKGNILIIISHENKKIKITYKDNGCGIKKQNIVKIFDPFFTTNRENGGSGLGLNIIYTIITSSLNGSITCTSDVNEGVEFIIRFNAEIV